MNVVSADLKSETGSASKDGRSYERVYNVYFTGGYNCAALLKYTGSLLPKVGQNHPDDNRAVVANTKPALDDEESGAGAGMCTVTVSYEPKPLGESGDNDTAPWDRPPKWDFPDGDKTEVRKIDVDKKPIINSKGDWYTDIPPRPIRGYCKCVVTRNEQHTPATNIVLYSNTTNESEWYGVAVGNGLMGRITASPQTEQYLGEDVSFWTVTYPLEFIRDDDGNGWNTKLIDNGFKYLDDDEKEVVPTDCVGNVTPVPILLDGHGKQLVAGGDPVTFPDEGFVQIDRIDWSGLNLPDIFGELPTT